MKVVTVVGARPQFIKASALSQAIRQAGSIEEKIIHTGQHFDDNMSHNFFAELNLPQPQWSLGIASLSHGAMTGRMLEGIESILAEEKPAWLIVYGDTNSTLAGALAAAKLHIPVAHIEAGLRSFNRRMPEEINRILTDHVAKLLFCPTEEAKNHLQREGITQGVHVVGDLQLEATSVHMQQACARYPLANYQVEAKKYVLCTIHRAENTDDPERMQQILTALLAIQQQMPVILPVHPRTRQWLQQHGWLERLSSLILLPPISFLAMIRLEKDAFMIITDSGGVQKEALFHGVYCLTTRDETEWVESVALGWNRLCGANCQQILAAWQTPWQPTGPSPYQAQDCGHKIVTTLLQNTL